MPSAPGRRIVALSQGLLVQRHSRHFYRHLRRCFPFFLISVRPAQAARRCAGPASLARYLVLMDAHFLAGRCIFPFGIAVCHGSPTVRCEPLSSSNVSL